MSYGIFLSGAVRSSLIALQNTQSAIDATNRRLTTGKKVDSAVGDAVAFFSAKALKGRASDFDGYKAEIGQSIGAVRAALTATQSIDGFLKQLKGIVTAAKAASAIERGALQTQFNIVKNQIDHLVADATYQGINLVGTSTARLDTRFSERSSSRLTVRGRRLSTYRTVVAEASRRLNWQRAGLPWWNTINIGAIWHDNGRNFSVMARGRNFHFYAGGVGTYHVAAVMSGGVFLSLDFIRYNTIFNTTHERDRAAIVRLDNALGFSIRLDKVYIASRDNAHSPVFDIPNRPRWQTQFNEVSGLNIFMASQIYIIADMGVTGSHAITTFSTGTLWSMTAFDLSAGTASQPFLKALDFVMKGIDDSIRRNKGAAKALGANVAILSTRLGFTKSYVNVQLEGAGKLTLTNTSEEGASLVALQTRRLLGTRALAFAGRSERSVLRLFR